MFGFVIYKRYLTNKKKRDEAEPLQCVPNTMKLITVKENELELHQGTFFIVSPICTTKLNTLELGTGAFGTVHRATWKPAKEKDHPEKVGCFFGRGQKNLVKYFAFECCFGASRGH